MIDRLVLRVLEWAAGHTDEGRYSPVAIVFHWTMAILATAQLALGWAMGRLAAGGAKVAAFDWHFAIGVVMFVLALGRAGWRLLAPGPINDADKPGWESTAAHVTHYIFYTCLFGLPLSGWAMVSATAPATNLHLLGLPWPLMPFQDLTAQQLWAIEAFAEWLHWGLVIALLLMIPLHAGAALKHHVIDGDDVLHAMAPIVPQRSPARGALARRVRAFERGLVARAKRLWPADQSSKDPTQPAS